jgi:O-antigen/teichoic acid export membrane protein
MNLKKFFFSELGKSSLILFIMINLFNILNFLFHFSMGRMLGPEDYGVLAVLMSLAYIYSIPNEAIQTLISKYTSKLNIKKEYGKIKFLLFKSLKKGIVVSIILFFMLSIISIFIANSLEINYWLIIFINLFIFSSFLTPIARGVLQGRKHFSKLGISMILESTIKLILAIVFVALGFKVFGAIMGLLLGIFVGLLFAISFNKKILMQKQEKSDFEGIYFQSIAYFIVMFIIFLAFSMDILIAKIFFSPLIAGKYAVVSMLGKMIFLGTMAISKAMFPLTSENNENGTNSFNLFKKSFLLISGICFLSTLIFLFFPKLIIFIFYGKQYIGMAPYLVYSSIAFSFLALSNLNLIYGLSINKMKYSFLLLIPLLIEIFLLFIFNRNLLEFVLTFMFSNIIIFICSLFFIKK